MLPSIRHTITVQHLLAPGQRVLVAVSGGVDSMVLLHVLRDLGFAVEAAHIDHGLRGEASTADRDLVVSQCERLGVPCQVRALDPAWIKEAPGRSVQMAARELRREALVAIARERGMETIATAHHADDALETLLMNLMRGTGWRGWAGIPVRSGPFIRPLIDVDRASIEAFARVHAIPFRDDRSNHDPAYLRNRVRHELLPLMEALRPGSGATARRSMGSLRSLVRFAGEGLRARFGASLKEYGSIDLLLLKDTGALGLAWVLHDLDVHPHTQDRILRTIETGEHGERFEVEGGTIWIERDRLVLRTEQDPPAERVIHGLEQAGDSGIAVEELPIDRWDRKPDPATAWIDPGKAPFPWTLRPWRNGDRMRPLGLGGSKLVSDLLTDAKVDRSARASARVVESAGRIIWLVGHRVDESVAIGADTTRVLRIKLVGG